MRQGGEIERQSESERKWKIGIIWLQSIPLNCKSALELVGRIEIPQGQSPLSSSSPICMYVNSSDD